VSRKLQGLKAVVTGGGSGIGRATCAALARNGAHVAVWDLAASSAQQTCDEIVAEGGQALLLQGSVADPEQVSNCFRMLDERWGKVDILVNNAGISGNRPTLELENNEWDRAVAINMSGVFYCCREAGRRMKDRGGGRIVNVGSIYSLVAAPNRLSYCATKAAVAMMTRSLAVEWAQYGIRVNCVAPGYVSTPLLDELAADGRVDLPALLRRIPQGRLATIDEVSDAIVYFCEPRSAHVTGQTFAIDGGWTANGYL
jgi:NAD(P)-dependent dehydrogenase (short-subunit alcohol dehydrogenase family)